MNEPRGQVTVHSNDTYILGENFGSEDMLFALRFDVDLTQRTVYIRAVRNEMELISTTFLYGHQI
jgi:hypothetical protein